MKRWIERVWARDGAAARALAPLSWLFGAATVLRNAAYDRGVFASVPLGLPTISVGNLSVGGTGKTPVSAWVAQQLIARGHRPAILLRGYGDDEPLVHERLTPGAIVVADPDRRRGAQAAIARGATALVLDDAFQHRRAARDVDLVLVAAEQGGARRLLPAGPLREGRRALGRASALVITRKTATATDAEKVALDWSASIPGLPSVRVLLRADRLVRVETIARGADASGGQRPGGHVAGDPAPDLDSRRILAISAIGDAAAFEGQLRAQGAIVESAALADHHAYSDADATRLAMRAASLDLAVCTLKDAVKLASRWPAHGPALWYLSQSLVVESGESVLMGLLAGIGDPVRPDSRP